MSSFALERTPARRLAESLRAALELLKPITWFPPMWALACGVVSSGAPMWEQRGKIAIGILLAGPLLCGASQVVNDWFDRHVDAINEPHRPIPSGRIPGRWGLYLAIAWSVVSLLVAASLGPWVLRASILGLLLAWAYSAPPIRLKQNGWLGNLAVGFSYEGLAWITGAALMSAGQMPSTRSITLAVLYSLGAHGIMTLNDFKSIDGDRKLGIRSLPASLGADRAARIACVVMTIPQLAVLGLLLAWSRPIHAVLLAVLIAMQLACMPRLLRDPRAAAPWYNGTGVTLYVLGMLGAAVALR